MLQLDSAFHLLSSDMVRDRRIGLVFLFVSIGSAGQWGAGIGEAGDPLPRRVQFVMSIPHVNCGTGVGLNLPM
jgi:hypothetical protein